MSTFRIFLPFAGTGFPSGESSPRCRALGLEPHTQKGVHLLRPKELQKGCDAAIHDASPVCCSAVVLYVPFFGMGQTSTNYI